MKRSTIRPVSPKRARANRERTKLVNAMKAAGPVMCVRCGGRADDLHEILSRARGGSVTDPANCVPLCREDHDWVTEHPLGATALGLSRRREV